MKAIHRIWEWAKNRKTVWQFIQFGLVGASNTAISMGIYYLFLFIDPKLYLVGCVVGGVVSIANAFFWNDRFVFRGNESDWRSRLRRLGRTYVSYSGTSLLGIALLWIEVNALGFSKSVAPIVNLAVTVPLNFLINKFWTFRRREDDRP